MKMLQDAVERFFYWINERHSIYLKKEAGESWPWTDDVILQTYKFTNVFRELDKGTIWLRENWLEPFADDPKLYFNIAMYRQFNWPPTMERIGYIIDSMEDDSNYFPHHVNVWNPRQLTKIVEDYQHAGNQVWTGAYMIRGQYINPTGVLWTSKAQYMFHQVLDPVWNAPEPEWKTLQESWQWWQQFEGFGPFLGYEIVTDMRHTRYLKNAPDIMTWANPGPGAMRGIKRLYGMAVDAHRSDFTYGFYIEVMKFLLDMSANHTGDHVPAMEMRDIEHSLCEFDKYERVRLGQGRPRSKYTPSHLK